MKHDISIPRQSIRILIPRIMDPEGWCNTVKLYNAAGSILEHEVLSTLVDQDPPQATEGETKPDYIKRAKPWLDEIVSFSITESEREAVKSCLKHAIKGSKLPGSGYTAKLLTAFAIED